MTTTASAFSRDANRVPIWSKGIIVSKTITYVAATTGAIASSTLFTVTGDVMVNLFAVCSTSLNSGGAATIEAGIVGNTASLLAQTTATNIDGGHVWVDSTPATVEAEPTWKIFTNGTDITQDIASATLTAGVLTYYCLWVPLSANGDVVAA